MPWRKATPEQEALFEREMMRRQARPYAAKSAVASGAAPSRVVREEAAPMSLYGWDGTTGKMMAFGYVGAPIGSTVSNPSKPPF